MCAGAVVGPLAESGEGAGGHPVRPPAGGGGGVDPGAPPGRALRGPPVAHRESGAQEDSSTEDDALCAGGHRARERPPARPAQEVQEAWARLPRHRHRRQRQVLCHPELLPVLGPLLQEGSTFVASVLHGFCL